MDELRRKASAAEKLLEFMCSGTSEAVDKQTVKELRREFWKGLHTVGRRIPGGSLDLLGAWKAFLKAKVKDFKFETNVMRHCH
jgi:hypothetical protein